MLQKFKIFLEMIKFEHSVFALPFAYLGMILARRGWPGFEIFFLITIAMISFRTMAMAANRLIDAPIDAQNPRTSLRAIPAGLLKKSTVLVLIVIDLIIFEIVCWKMNYLCFVLSPLPVALALLYPYLKRVTVLCHFLLGLILGIAPYGAWLAVRPEFSWTPAYLTLGVLFWTAGFDIIYALLDTDFDRARQLYSIPAKVGDVAAKVIARGLHVVSFLFWVMAGLSATLNWIYFAGVLVVAVLMIREHGLIRQSADLEKINVAFFTLNAWISIILFFSGIGGLQ